MVFHIIVESLAILVSIYYLLFLVKKQKTKLRQIALYIIAWANILIDVYAILTWFMEGFMSKEIFHRITEALAFPAGIYLIWLSTKQEKWYDKTIILIMGLGNIFIDGYLFFFSWR